MSDTLKGYTVSGMTDEDDFVAVSCDQCGDRLTGGYNVPLESLVRAATEHSGRCLG